MEYTSRSGGSLESLCLRNILLCTRWGRHAFPPATNETLDLLSNFHMANNLQYVAAQVAACLVATVEHLRHVNSGMVELNFVKAERDELKTKLAVLEAETHIFEECYDLFAGEKASVEEQVTNLDGSVERLSRRVEVLVVEKVLEDQAMEQPRQLEVEELRRNTVE